MQRRAEQKPTRRSLRMMAVWIALTLPILQGCSTVAKTETVKLRPPAHFYQPRGIPSYAGTTYRDLARYSIQLKRLAQSCEADKAAIREWASEGE